MTSSTMSRQALARSPSRSRALPVVAAVAAGAVVPVQSRVNAELSHRLGDGTAAATISFTGGLIIMSVLALLLPGLRRALKDLPAATRERGLPRRYLLAGALGGTFALAQSTVALVTGIAVFTVSAIAGQTVGGLIVDARGVGGGVRRRPGVHRLAGALLTLVAAVVSALPGLAGVPSAATVLLPALLAVLGGLLLGLQQAMNGTTGAAVASPLAATWVNFAVGSIVLGLALTAKTLAGGTSGAAQPTAWWMYLGGLCGVVFIGTAAVLVRRIGVLLLGMASIAGQLAGSIVLDAVPPSGDHPPGAFTVAGALLTFAAVWIAARRSGLPNNTKERPCRTTAS
ncbi:DMT family transporter [Nonomuraea sp. NPDC049309]|uniref:DMT family transporter n=1 Tax=Nonomuraea sp. NPDC049309 TaxID=3364350 RepID=UPI00372419F3